MTPRRTAQPRDREPERVADIMAREIARQRTAYEILRKKELAVMEAAHTVAYAFGVAGSQHSIPLSINLRNLRDAITEWEKAMHMLRTDQTLGGRFAGSKPRAGRRPGGPQLSGRGGAGR